jgi:hypothetical protein
MIKALAEGRQAFPVGRALGSPQLQGLIRQVAQYDPSFDAVNYQSRAKVRENFTSGSAAQQINSLNTAIGHLKELSAATDALGNTSIPYLNTAKNYLAQQAGSSAPTNFDAVANKVAQETTRVWRGTGGSEADIKADRDILTRNNSPEQIHGAISEIGHLFESKLQALQDQYRQGMGISDIKMLTPESRSTLDLLEQRASGQPKSSAATVGEIRVVNGQRAQWDGKGWVSIK